MQNRKGLSDVVSTVLIILLVVAAIAIIGAIVLNVVQNAGDKIDATTQCLNLDIKAISCEDNADEIQWAVVSRGSGGSDVKLSKINLLFKDQNGILLGTSTINGNPAINNAIKYTGSDVGEDGNAINVGSSTLTKVSVVATVDGASQSCEETTPVVCSRIP